MRWWKPRGGGCLRRGGHWYRHYSRQHRAGGPRPTWRYGRLGLHPAKTCRRRQRQTRRLVWRQHWQRGSGRPSPVHPTLATPGRRRPTLGRGQGVTRRGGRGRHAHCPGTRAAMATTSSGGHLPPTASATRVAPALAAASCKVRPPLRAACRNGPTAATAVVALLPLPPLAVACGDRRLRRRPLAAPRRLGSLAVAPPPGSPPPPWHCAPVPWAAALAWAAAAAAA